MQMTLGLFTRAQGSPKNMKQKDCSYACLALCILKWRRLIFQGVIWVLSSTGGWQGSAHGAQSLDTVSEEQV